MKQTWMPAILIAGCLMMVGCQSESDRIAILAERTIESQNEVNSANAKAVDEIVRLNWEVQQERNSLQQEKQTLNQQFNELETNRRNLHRLRRSELAWSDSFRFLAIVIAAGMPLFLCAYLIWAASRQTSCHEAVNEILVRELVSFRPRLITAPNLPAIEHSSESSDTESNNPGG